MARKSPTCLKGEDELSPTPMIASIADPCFENFIFATAPMDRGPSLRKPAELPTIWHRGSWGHSGLDCWNNKRLVARHDPCAKPFDIQRSGCARLIFFARFSFNFPAASRLSTAGSPGR